MKKKKQLTDETRLAKLMPEKIELGTVSRGKTNMNNNKKGKQTID